MNIFRTIKHNGTHLRVHGNYTKATPSEDGSLPLGAEFIVSKVIDVSDEKEEKVVTDLYNDMLNEVSCEVLIVLQNEDSDDTEDIDQLDYEAIMSAAMSFTDNGINYVEPKRSIVPITVSDTFNIEVIDTEQVQHLIDDLSSLLYSEDNPVVAARLDNNGIRLIRLNDLNKLK